MVDWTARTLSVVAGIAAALAIAARSGMAMVANIVTVDHAVIILVAMFMAIYFSTVIAAVWRLLGRPHNRFGLADIQPGSATAMVECGRLQAKGRIAANDLPIVQIGVRVGGHGSEVVNVKVKGGIFDVDQALLPRSGSWTGKPQLYICDAWIRPWWYPRARHLPKGNVDAMPFQMESP